VIEVVAGKSLYQFEKENIFDALGMGDTAFSVTDTAKQSLIAEPLSTDILNGHRVLSPATVAFMTSDHLGQIGPGPTAYLPGPGYGIGFAVRRQQGVATTEGSPAIIIGSAPQAPWDDKGNVSAWIYTQEDGAGIDLVRVRLEHRRCFRDDDADRWLESPQTSKK
jgi:CubicO group peptidase (beta-lactamase class C family)